MTKAGILGSGQVAQALATGFVKHGHSVMMGSRDPGKLETWRRNAGLELKTGTFQDAAGFGEIVVLAVAGTAAEEAVRLAGIEKLNGKTVIDVTNPISKEPPVNGVLRFFTSLDDSLMERLQRIAPGAHFVKAFSCVGSALMVDPRFPQGTPTMFICGNDTGAKEEVTKILADFGWGVADMGKIEAARAIEPLSMLWCIPGFLHNQWDHALALLKM